MHGVQIEVMESSLTTNKVELSRYLCFFESAILEYTSHLELLDCIGKTEPIWLLGSTFKTCISLPHLVLQP